MHVRSIRSLTISTAFVLFASVVAFPLITFAQAQSFEITNCIFLGEETEDGMSRFPVTEDPTLFNTTCFVAYGGETSQNLMARIYAQTAGTNDVRVIADSPVSIHPPESGITISAQTSLPQGEYTLMIRLESDKGVLVSNEYVRSIQVGTPTVETPTNVSDQQVESETAINGKSPALSVFIVSILFAIVALILYRKEKKSDSNGPSATLPMLVLMILFFVGVNVQDVGAQSTGPAGSCTSGSFGHMQVDICFSAPPACAGVEVFRVWNAGNSSWELWQNGDPGCITSCSGYNVWYYQIPAACQLGLCGTANGGSFSTAPSSNLCNVGMISWTDSTGGDGTFNWECRGTGPSSNTANCSAIKTPPANCTALSPACWSVSGNLCCANLPALNDGQQTTIYDNDLYINEGEAAYRCNSGSLQTLSSTCNQITGNISTTPAGECQIPRDNYRCSVNVSWDAFYTPRTSVVRNPGGLWSDVDNSHSQLYEWVDRNGLTFELYPQWNGGGNKLSEVYVRGRCTGTDVFDVSGYCRAAPQPDLIAMNLQRAGTLTEGSTLIFTGNIRNQGSASAAASNARFCIDNLNCLTTPTGRIGSDIPVSGLNAGETSSQLTTSWIATAGTHTVYFCADVSGAVPESSDGNNCTSLGGWTVSAAPQPDLIAMNLQRAGTLTEGSTLIFTGNIRNQGSASAAASNARFCIDNLNCLTTPTGRIGSDIPVSGLNAGETSSQLTTSWIATAGTHTVYFCADVSGAVPESSDGNNCTSLGGWTVSASALPPAPPAGSCGSSIGWSNDQCPGVCSSNVELYLVRRGDNGQMELWQSGNASCDFRACNTRTIRYYQTSGLSACAATPTGQFTNITTCSIPNGANSCTGSASWSTNNVPPSNSAFVWISNAVSPGSFVGTGLSGTAAVNFYHGNNTLTLREGNTNNTLATEPRTISCSSGNWNSTTLRCEAAASQADLTATNVSPAAGATLNNPASITFQGAIANTGTGPTAAGENVWPDLEIDWNQGNCSAAVPEQSFNAGGPWFSVASGWSQTVSKTLAAASSELRNGTHCYRFIADRDNWVTESNNNNNGAAWRSFAISGLPQCSNGIDDSDLEDMLIDMADPGCSSSNDDDEVDPPLPTPRLIVCPENPSVTVSGNTSLNARYWANSGTIPDCSTAGYSTVTDSANWTTSNPTHATVTNTSPKGVVNGVAVGSPTITASYSGLSAPVTINVVSAATPPTVTINACNLGGSGCISGPGTKSINSGTDIEIRWSANDADSCTKLSGSADFSVSGTSGTDNTVTEPSAGNSTTFTVRCTNTNGDTDRSVTVSTNALTPTGDIRANGGNSSTITSGDSVNITWESQNSSSCQVTNTNDGTTWSGTQNLMPGQSHTPAGSAPYTVTYVLNCDGGAPEDSVIVNVNAVAINPTLTALPDRIRAGTQATLEYNTGSYNPSTNLPLSQCTVTGPGSFTFTITSQGTGIVLPKPTVNAESVYTLNCPGYPPDTAVVKIIPIGYEG